MDYINVRSFDSLLGADWLHSCRHAKEEENSSTELFLGAQDPYKF
jgi:hypothetical protein